MYTPVFFSRAALEPAIARLQEGSPLNVRDHNALVVALASISDAMTDPARHFDPQGSFVFPTGDWQGETLKIVGLESEPTSWWNPSETGALVSLQRAAYRAAQQILIQLASGRAMEGTRPAGAASGQYLGLSTDQRVLTVNRAGNAARIADETQTMFYGPDFQGARIAAAIKYISWVAGYVADATYSRLTASSNLYPVEGKAAAEEFAETYRVEAIRAYWISLGVFGLAIAGSLLAAYTADPEQLEMRALRA